MAHAQCEYSAWTNTRRRRQQYLFFVFVRDTMRSALSRRKKLKIICLRCIILLIPAQIQSGMELRQLRAGIEEIKNELKTELEQRLLN